MPATLYLPQEYFASHSAFNASYLRSSPLARHFQSIGQS